MTSQAQLQILKAAAKAGGRETLRFFDKPMKVRRKGPHGDAVTEADLASERAIFKILNSHFPDYNLYSEEAGTKNRGSEYTLVVDPLDGTFNFKYHMPLFAVSIALMKKEQSIIGVIYVPSTSDMYTAVQNRGARKNGRRISVRPTRVYSGAVVSYSHGWEISHTELTQRSLRLVRLGVRRVVNTWSPALELAWVADGKLDAFIGNRNSLHDIAAGKLIAREAGATISYLPKSISHNDSETLFIASCTKQLGGALSKICKTL